MTRAPILQTGEDVPRLQRKEIDDCKDCSYLEDTTPDVDAFVNAGLDAARADAEADLSASASEGRAPKHLAVFAFERLGRQVALGTTPLDEWAESLPGTKAEPQKPSETKFAGAPGLLGIDLTYARLMRIGDVCIGSDKLGHVTENGYYALLVSEPLAGGSGGEVAAIKHGATEEERDFGLRLTGVFSNADIAANVAGLRFYRALIADEGLRFSIADYIGPDWNECSNSSFFTEGVATVVWTNLFSRRPWGGRVGLTNEETAVSVQFTSVEKVETMKASGTPALGIAAVYRYQSGSERAEGRLSGRGEFIEAVPARDLPFPERDIPAGYRGLSLHFDWTEGFRSGSGKWITQGERALVGSWGYGGSVNSRGEWRLTLGSDPVPRDPQEEFRSDQELEIARARKHVLQRWLQRVERRKRDPRRLIHLRARRARLVFALEKHGELEAPLGRDVRTRLLSFIEGEAVRFRDVTPIEIRGGPE